VCVETIYTALYTGAFGAKPTERLRMRRPRPRYRQACHTNQHPDLPNIAGRPDTVNDHAKPGHWEAARLIGLPAAPNLQA